MVVQHHCCSWHRAVSCWLLPARVFWQHVAVPRFVPSSWPVTGWLPEATPATRAVRSISTLAMREMRMQIREEQRDLCILMYTVYNIISSQFAFSSLKHPETLLCMIRWPSCCTANEWFRRMITPCKHGRLPFAQPGQGMKNTMHTTSLNP